MSADCQLMKLGLVPILSQRLGVSGYIYFSDYISKEYLPGPWERHSWVVKLANGEDLYVSKEQRGMCNHKFAKVNVPKEREVGGLESGKKKAYVN